MIERSLLNLYFVSEVHSMSSSNPVAFVGK